MSSLIYKCYLLRCRVAMGTEGSTVREIFPDEIITEILTRLPAKSLLRFRCVSKSWLALISSPTFIQAHLDTGLSNTSYSRHLLICISADPTSRFREFPLRFLLRGQPSVNSVASDGYDLANPDMPMWIVGSCRGMVCVSLDEENLVLWNPSIGKHKRLPYIKIGPGSGSYMKDGFGYDESSDDYKVVAIFLSIFQNGPYRVMMFSLRANRWRRVEDFRHGTPLDNSGKYSNGKLHWLVNCEGRMGIVSLDLSSERYGEMGLPRNSADISTCCCTITELDDPCVTLGLFGGGLCLMFDDHRACMHLWVMKEYGVRDSWARVLVMPHMGSPGFYPHMLRAWVLNGGEILLLYGCVVVVYDPRGDRFRYPPIDDLGAIVQADVYVESLVSPSD